LKLSQYGLIITDLDGTLVRYGTNELSEATIRVFKDLKQRGFLLSIATGRSWRHTQTIAEKLQLTTPVIVQAGAIIVDPLTGKSIRTIPLRPKIRQRLEKAFQIPPTDLFCLDDTGAYFTTRINSKAGADFMKNYQEFCGVGIPSELPATVIKHLYIGPEQILKQLTEHIHKKIRPRPNLILWPPDSEVDVWMLEVFDPLSSKGQAVKWLADTVQVERKKVIAFGDSYNDIDLLKWAGLGVAIQGAPLPITSQADFVIPQPEVDGVARFLSGEFQLNRDKFSLNPFIKYFKGL
jgi:Cof subfamily protein (haloacid dehalogenase superfamily)